MIAAGERGLVRCSECGWESGPQEVNEDSPHGRWFALQRAIIDLGEHRCQECLPEPHEGGYGHCECECHEPCGQPPAQADDSGRFPQEQP